MFNLATNGNSPAHYAKGTRSLIESPKESHRAPTACRCMVSGTFNSPNRGTFHLSVTLLFTIGRRGVFSLGGWTPQLHTEFHELHATLVRLSHPHRLLQDCHLLWFGFPARFTDKLEVPCRRPQPRAEARFGLFRFRSPLLTESRLLSVPPVTEMFQFTGFAPTTYAFSCR